MVQLREKEWPSGRLLPLARRLRERCRRAGATFIVNDRVDLALPRTPTACTSARTTCPRRLPVPWLRPGMILGLSTHSPEQARVAQAAGADYVAVGSMFPTASKPDFRSSVPR